MSYKEADRVGLIRAVVEKRLRQREAAWNRCSPGQAPGTAVPVGRSGGPGVGPSRQAPEQRHRRGGPAGGAGPGAEALCGFRPDIGVREAGGGARLPAVGGDLAPVDDGRGVVAFEGATFERCAAPVRDSQRAPGAVPVVAASGPATRSCGAVADAARIAAGAHRGGGSAGGAYGLLGVWHAIGRSWMG